MGAEGKSLSMGVCQLMSDIFSRLKIFQVGIVVALLVGLALFQALTPPLIYVSATSSTIAKRFDVITTLRPLDSSVRSFSFAAIGDYNFSSFTSAIWKSLSGSDGNFVLGLGDFLYHRPPPSEQAWCNDFKGNITNVELLVGNHETFESNSTDPGGGSINKFLQYCPFTLGALGGTYGFQYYFDYPTANPLARFIMVDPDIWLGSTVNSNVSYGDGTMAQQWVGNQVDAARAAGIPWVIVGMHKDCISAGMEFCEIGQDFMRFLINKKVDLVLQGHDHNYQRSKQLTCATSRLYVASCVANDGLSGSYAKGAGTVFLIDGTAGAERFPIATNDPDYPYFAKTNDTTFGYTKYTVTQTSISAKFFNTTGTFTDTWSVDQPGSGTFTLNASPGQLTVNQRGTGEWPSTTVTITLASLGGYTGQATLIANVSGSCYSCPPATIAPQTVLLPSNGQATAILTIKPPVELAGGLWVIYVNATVNKLSQIVPVTVIFQPSYFTMQAPNDTSIIFPGSTLTESVQLQSHYNFTDTITLRTNLDPDFARYLRVSFTPSTLTLTPKANQTVTVAISVSSDALGIFGCRCSITLEADGSWWKAYGSLPVDIPTHTYPPGVQAGTWARYNLTRPDAETETIRATIIQVEDSNVTYTIDIYNVNQLVNSTTTWTDLVTGQNPKPIIPFFLIAGNLSEGLPIYEADQFQSIAIRVDSTEPLAETLRATLGAQTLPNQPGANFWWDAHTGMLAHFDTSILVNNQPVAVHFELVDTNAWARLTATLTASPTKGTAPVTIAFSTQVSGGTSPYDFYWDFGDMQASIIENPAHTYTTPGNYTVTLRVRDAFGDIEDKTVNISATRSIVSANPPPMDPRPTDPIVLATAIIAMFALVAIVATLLIRSRRPKQPRLGL